MADTEPVFLFEEDPSLLITDVSVIVMSGSADDPAAKAGLTNLMGDLLVRGTKTRSRDKFQDELERLGASINVLVSIDGMVINGRVIKENTMAFLALLEDTILNPSFSVKEFNGLKREIVASIANLKNSNARLAGLNLRRHVFEGTVLERPGDGSLTTVKSIKREDVLKVYKERIHKGNVLFGVASGLKEAEIKKPLVGIWKRLPVGTRTTREPIKPKTPEKPTILVVDKPGSSTGNILFGQAGIVANDPRRFALFMGNFSFGGEPLVSRLFRTVRSELGWTYSVGSTYFATGSLTKQPGLFAISASPSVEFTGKTILKLKSMWDTFYAEGLKKDEYSLSQESLVNSYPFEFDSAQKRLGKKTYSYLYDVKTLSPEEYAKTLKGISMKNVLETMTGAQTKDGWVISVVGDAKVIQKQLEEEQKEVPAEARLKVAKVLNPDDVIK